MKKELLACLVCPLLIAGTYEDQFNAELEYVAPTERMDGTPLSEVEIDKYQICRSPTASCECESVGLIDSTELAILLDDTVPHDGTTIYFCVRTMDTDGFVGKWSDSMGKAVNPPSTMVINSLR